MEVGGEETAAARLGQSRQHLSGDVGGLEGACGGQGLVQKHQGMGGDGVEDLTQTGAFLAQTSLVDGVVGACGEVGEDAVGGADLADLGGEVHTQLEHGLAEADGAGDDRLTASVGAREDVDHGVFGGIVKVDIVGDDLLAVAELEGYGGVIQLGRAEDIVLHGAQGGGAEGTALVQKLLLELGALHHELDLGHQPQEEVGVLQDVSLDDLLPGAERGLVDLPDGGVEGQGQGGLLIVGLLLAEGDQGGNAGVLVVLEVEAQDLLQHLTRLEGLGVDGEDARLGGTELGVEIHADGDALDLADPAGQLGELLVQLAVVIGLGQIHDAVAEPLEGGAAQVGFHLGHALVEDIHAGDVQLDFRHAGEVGGGIVVAVTFQTAELSDVLEDGDQAVEGVQQGGVIQKIREGLVSVGDDGGIRGEMLGGGGALGVEELQHTQLLEGVHINVGDAHPREMILLGLAVGVEEGEVFQFHEEYSFRSRYKIRDTRYKI